MEFNIGSNWVVFEMNEDTTKYEVSRAYKLHWNSSWGISSWEEKNLTISIIQQKVLHM